MKIAIVGPVQPFRSGIARHTASVAREFARRDGAEVAIFSFSRQYPRFLFPGDDDRDREAAPPEGLDVAYVLDSVNPASWRNTAAEILRSGPDLVVMPAWTFFVAPCLGFIARALRRNGIPVVMIAHNAGDHEAAGWKQSLTDFQFRNADGFLAHNPSTEAALKKRFPQQRLAVHPHPHFDDYPQAEGNLPRRAALELLFFGLVRSYKGVDIAIRALAASGLKDVRLSIVGEFWSGLAETEKLVGELGLGDRVEIVPRYVTDREAADFFARCDAVILPYRSATGSGVLALAQRYRRPVIASDVPGLAEAIEDRRTGWLFAPEDVGNLARVMSAEVTAAAAMEMRPAIRALDETHGWKSFVDSLIGLSGIHAPAGRRGSGGDGLRSDES